MGVHKVVVVVRFVVSLMLVVFLKLLSTLFWHCRIDVDGDKMAMEMRWMMLLVVVDDNVM